MTGFTVRVLRLAIRRLRRVNGKAIGRRGSGQTFLLQKVMGSNPAEFEDSFIKTESQAVTAADSDFVFIGSFQFF